MEAGNGGCFGEGEVKGGRELLVSQLRFPVGLWAKLRIGRGVKRGWGDRWRGARLPVKQREVAQKDRKGAGRRKTD